MAALVEMQNNAAIKIKPEELIEYCKSAGGRFIRLRHKKSVASLVRGFQPAILRVERVNGAVNVTFIPKTTYDGKIFKDGRLEFSSDRLGILWAELPDTPYNRKLLSACIHSNTAEWEIADPEDRSMISSLAKQYADELNWNKEKEVILEPKPFRQTVDAPEKKSEETRNTIIEQEVVSVPTFTIGSADQPFNPPPSKRGRKKMAHTIGAGEGVTVGNIGSGNAA